MLSYNRLNFVSFQGWSSKGAIGNVGNPFWNPHTNALIQPVKFHFISGLVIKRGLELMASTLGSTFWKEGIGIWSPILAVSPLQVFLMKDLVWKVSSKIREWMEVEISPIVKIFKLYPSKRKTRSWGSIGALQSVRSQSTAEIFLTPDHMGGIHITLVMWRSGMGFERVSLVKIRICCRFGKSSLPAYIEATSISACRSKPRVSNGNTLRATSHTRLRAHDHNTSSILIGGKGGVGPSSLLDTTLEGPRWL